MNTSAVAGNPEPSIVKCFHCGEAVPPDLFLSVIVNGAGRPMCCYGCQAVAQTIVNCGLGDYYKYRKCNSLTPDQIIPEQLHKLRIFDNDLIQQTFITKNAANHYEANLVLEGIVCPACIWLIEKRLGAMPGMSSININYDTNHARLAWDNSLIPFSKILEEISRLGYRAYPSTNIQDQYLFEKHRKSQLLRLGLAGLLGMQVMMSSVALYTGNWSPADAGIKNFLCWFNLVLTTPVLLYSAQPFYQGAWRDLKLLRAGMDVPVSLGITIAYLGSLRSTIQGTGEIYYDSVVMFVFLLLLGRYLEFMARKKARERTDSMYCALPATATRLYNVNDGHTDEIVPVAALRPRDRVLVRAGESIAADGIVTDGISTVDESLLTGEGRPVVKQNGSALIAGSINIESPLEMTVTRTGAETVLSNILKIIERAQGEKPGFTQLANRIAGWFIPVILILAGISACYWWYAGHDLWLPVTISILVASCPCALSLATPAAMTAASSTLLQMGIAVANNNAIEKLARATHYIFDKTGTLTLGKPKLDSLRCLSSLNREECLAIMASLETKSEHPVAGAILAAADKSMIGTATDTRNYPGRGITGSVNGVQYFIGTMEFISDMTGLKPGGAIVQNPDPDHGTVIYLADQGHWLCRSSFSDEIRPHADTLIQSLKASGKNVIMLSGDNYPSVKKIADGLHIDTFEGGLGPGDKLTFLQGLQKKNAAIAMIGDGVNDAPVLAGADVSIAMGGGTDLARINADLIVMNDQLDTLLKALHVSRRTLAIIRENIAWSIAYNLLIIPAAVAGLVAPWMAALGMSLSSLIVIGNSSRIYKCA